MKIIESIHQDVLEKSVALARERNVILPTFAQQKDPSRIPPAIVARLAELGLWDIDPANLFRITWHNEPVERGGGFGEGNWIEFPSELTGVDARIVGILGHWFPTGAHKVGAAYGCLVPRLVSGNFDPTSQKAVWPSTGNYCRGGAYDCALLACPAVAILPEGMSRERFEWLKQIGTDEVIATPGTESNVKEIYDKCWELRAERGDGVVIFNQFEEFGNSIWHYQMTGSIIERIYESHYKTDRSRLAAYSAPPARPAPSPPATICAPATRRSGWSPPRRCSARPSTRWALASTGSRASATSTCRGSTTCATPTWSPPSTTSRR